MLTYKKTYLNPYEQAKENLQNDELYKELGGNETWTRYAKSGSLDTLLGTINEANSKMSISAVRDLPNWSMYDSEHKLQQLAVSLFSDNEKKKDREEITYDAEGNAQRHIISMTDREYYQKGLDEYASAQREKIRLAQEQAAKDNMNGLQKVVNNVGSRAGMFGLNLLNTAENIIDFVGTGITGLYKSIDALISDETEGGRWEAFDNAWREAGEISFSPTEDLRKSLYEWSRLNSDIVNVDGTPTEAYKFWTMLGDVTGQALTLMAFNFTGAGVTKLGATTSAAKAFTAVGTGIQKAGQFMYWGSMASSNYKELCQDESLASVPTLYLATNAMLRAGAEYAITRGMAKTFGASTLKQLTFNWTPKSGVVSGAKRLINDMLKEGTEEALQEYANQFINTATYIIHSKFGTKSSPLQDYAGFSMADMLNAFAAGALVSGLSSSINVLTTKQITTNEVRRDKNGNIIVDKAGEPVMKKFSKWQSWNIIANTKSLMHEIQSFCNDTSKPIEYRETMLGQAVQSFQLLSSFYGNIGQEASERVVSFMQEFAARYTTETNLTYTEQDLTEVVTKIGRELDRLAIKYSMDAAYNFEKAKEELAKKAKEAGITDIVEVHTKKEATATKEEVTPRTTAEERARAKIDALLLMDNTKTVSISKDGTNSINVDGHRIIPKNMIDSSTDIVTDVRKNDASNNFIDNIVNAKELKFAVNEIYNLYKKNYNRPDAAINEAVATLLNDGQFYKQALYQTSSVARQMLLQLDKIVDIASGDMITDAMYKQQIANTKKEWQKAVIEYLIIQDNLDESFITLLTNAQLSYVKSHRYGKDIANRIIEGTVTDADNKVMQTRINSMSISDKKKTELTDNLKSDDRRTRIGAVNYINNYYFGEYRNTFDGKIYPKLDTIGGWKLAQVLLNNNVTLESWLSTPIPNEVNESPDKTIENRKAYYKEQFAASTGNQYELNIADNGTYVIHENFAEQSKETGTIVFGGGRETELAKNIVINKVTNNKQYYEQYISKNISDIGKEYYTLTDYIRDSELLSKETKETILNKYGTVTEGTTFLFLRNEILAQTGSVSVVKLNNGEYALADIKPFFDILKNKNFVVTDNIKIEDVIKSKFLTGKLKNIKIVTNSKNGSYYDQDKNTIYLDEETVKDKLYGRYALVHEFQHAIQYMNNISSGIDIDAEYLGYLKPKVRNEILTELRKRIPTMSKFKKGGLDELTFAANFIYRQVTGEWDARGWLGNDIIDRVPMFRRDTAQGPVLDTPWGSYLLDSSKSYAYPIYEKHDNGIIVHDLIPTTDYQEYIYKDIMYPFENQLSEYEAKEISIEFDNKVSDNNIVREWIGVNMGSSDNATVRGSDISQDEARHNLYEYIQNNKDVRPIMLKKLWQDVAANLPYEDFLNTDIPFCRIQTNPTYWDSEFVSAVIGDTLTEEHWHYRYFSAVASIVDGSSDDKNFYLTAGTVKPKDLIGYIGDVEAEILLPVSIAANAKTFAAKELEMFGTVIIDPTEYVYDNLAIDNYKFVNKLNKQNFTKLFVTKFIKSNHLTNIRTSKSTFAYLLPTGDFAYSSDVLPISSAAIYDLARYYANSNNLTEAEARQLFNNVITFNFNAKDYDYVDSKIESVELKGMTSQVLFNKVYNFLFEELDKHYCDFVKVIYKQPLEEIRPWKLNNIDNTEDLNEVFHNFNKHYQFDQDGNPHKLYPKSRKIFDLTDEEKAKLETLTDEEKPGYLEFLKKEKKAKQKADYIAKHKNMVTDSTVQPKTPRYVSNKEAEKTNMKYFIRKYKPIQIDYETKNFIEAADPAQINKSIWKMIGGSEKGTLTYQKLMAWVRTIDYHKVNDYTWQLLNKTYFHNPVIKSFRQLNELATSKAGSYYAMWIALRDVGKIDILSKRIPINKFNELIAETETNKDSPLSKAYFKHLMSYSKAMEKNTDAKQGVARIVWAENFDGSIESGGRAAGFTYWLILSNYNAPDEKKTTSLNKQIGGDKGDDTEHELLDLIADPNSTKAFDVITGDVKPSQMSAYLKLYLSRKVYVQLDEGSITEEQAEEKTDAILKEVDRLNPDDLAERYFAAKVEDLTGDKTLLKAVSRAREKNKTLLPTRPKKTISDNINRISRNIINKLSPRELKKAEAEYPEYFKDGKINKEKWQGKNIEEYIAAENVLKEIQHKATYGYWNNTLAKEIFTQIEREKLKNEKLKGEKQVLKEKVQILKGEVKKYKQLASIKFADSSFDIHSDKPMPEKLKEILDTSFESVSNSEVKFVSTEDDKNMQISMHDFFEANAVTLASINQMEAEEIIDFYAHSTAIEGDITRNDIRKYDAFKIFILANFSDLQITGVYSFDEETNKTLNSLLNTSVSTAATVMNAWSKVVGLTNPSRTIVSNLRKYYGIEVSEDNVNELVKALKMPTTATANKTTEELNKEKIKAIQEALAVIQNEAKSQQLEHKKGDKLWDTLWKIERWAMLSAPGTAIRNAASNIVVDKFGRVAENIGSALFKKSKAKRDAAIDKYKKWKAANPNATEIPKDLIKELPGSYQVQYKQYQIAGTKVDEKTKTFVDKMFDEVLYSKTDNKGNTIKYSFYDTLSEGLSKYFDDKPHNIKGKANDMQTAANVMAKAIIVKIFGNQMFDTANIKNSKAKAVLQTMNKVSDFTFKWLNDDPWIKKETKRLLGKMLVEDNINLDNGYSTEVLDTLAEAYSLAAYKYMHRTNFINHIEHTIHNKLGAAGYFAFKQIFPFASAGLNWFMEGLNYTPLGLAMGIKNYVKLENTIERMEKTRSKAKEQGYSSVSPRFAEYLAKQQTGKGIIGSIGLLIGLLLGAVGLAAIDEEDDKYKLRIGTNTYIDISDIFGTQGILSGIAIASLFGDDSNSFWDVMKGTFNNLFEDFVFNDLYSNIQYSNTLTDYLVNTTENALLSFIPNFLKAFNRNLYTFTPQYSNNKLVKFLQRAGIQAIPGLAYALPKKINIYTGKVESKYNLPYLVKFINSNSPIDIAPYNVSDNEKEALLQGVNKSYLTGNYNDIGKLDSNDIIKLNKKYGELNDKSLSSLFASKEKYKVQKEDGTYVELYYNKMTQKQKESVIQRIMSDNALYAKVYVYTSNGGKYYTTENEYKTLKKLGISNVYIATSKKKGFS